MIEEAGFFVLYLFYGLVFFTIGAAISAKNLRSSNLKVARILWILALFAYTHGLSEWMELFIHMNFEHMQGEYFPYLNRIKFMMTGVSFVFLFWFGIELLFLQNFTRPFWFVLISLIGIGAGWVFITANHLVQYEIYLRHFIALPGANIAGLGFIRNAATLDDISKLGAKNLKIAGYAILLYGVFAGVFPSGTHIAGLPIELFRALAAFFILHGIVRGFKIFDDERKAKIEESFKRLSQSEKMVSLGKLSAGIAHEINNPLTNVLINVELLEKHLQNKNLLDDTCRLKIDAIKRNNGRASKIAAELLFFSHNRETEFELFSLNEIVRKTFQLIGSRRNLYDFQLALGEIPAVNGIPWKIEEVLLNLLINAMDATPTGGTIEVTTQVESNTLRCTIRDQGVGIREEDMKFVFDPFFTTKEPGKGTGLGLSICFRIMELHDGEILINSREGEGTVVHLLFPLPERESK